MRGIIRDPALKLVCVFVTTPDKLGQDAGALCGVEDIGTGASGNLEDVYRLKAACFSYVGSAAARELGACKEVAEFLKLGTKRGDVRGNPADQPGGRTRRTASRHRGSV